MGGERAKHAGVLSPQIFYSNKAAPLLFTTDIKVRLYIISSEQRVLLP